jgi:hypothetical protein
MLFWGSKEDFDCWRGDSAWVDEYGLVAWKSGMTFLARSVCFEFCVAWRSLTMGDCVTL